MCDDIDINVTETIDEISVAVTETIDDIDINVAENSDSASIAVSETSEEISIIVNETAEEITVNVGDGSTIVWGAITGLLSNQTDLQSALDAKEDALGYTPADEATTITGAGILTGQGGDLSTDRVFTLNQSDIDHDQTTNTHNLTTDIDHDQLTNYVANEHIDWTSTAENLVTSGDITCNTLNYTTLNPPIAGGGLTIGDSITGGAAQRILYEDSSNNLAQTSGFEFDGANTLTIPSGGAYQIGANQVLAGTGTVLECGDDVDGGTAAIFTGIGTDVGISLLTGTRNLFVGNNICNASSGGSKNGYDNILIGYYIARAGFALTSNARENVIIGNRGAYYLISATSNTGVGNRVLQNLQYGFGNTCYGASTGAQIYSANGNTLVGYNTGSSGDTSNRTLVGYALNISGDGNTAMGVSIGVTTGTRNAIFGTYAIGSSNPDHAVAVGYGAGQYTSTGSVSTGYQAGMQYNASKLYSIFHGWRAGFQLAGDDMLVMGRQAGGDYTNHTTDRVVLLGAYSGYYNNTADRLIIDNRQRANAATEVTDSLIHGNFNATASSQTLNLNARVLARFGIETIVANDNVSNPPTDAELDTAFGDPTTLNPGFIGVLDDNGGGINVYLCYTTGVAGEWYYLAGTKAV